MTFHNIFSSKKEPPTPKAQTIIIDIHEKNSLIPAELAKLNIPFQLESLKVGDYLVNTTVIERKTISDLKSSIISKRIFDQINNLKQHTSFILLIEGVQEELYNNKGMRENALRGFFLSLTKEKFPFILTESESDTAHYLVLLARTKSSSPPSLRPSRIPETREEQLQFILEGFPQIGPVKAKALLTHFHSLKNIINAQNSELEKVLGTYAKEFIELIHHQCFKE